MIADQKHRASAESIKRFAWRYIAQADLVATSYRRLPRPSPFKRYSGKADPRLLIVDDRLPWGGHGESGAPDQVAICLGHHAASRAGSLETLSHPACSR